MTTGGGVRGGGVGVGSRGGVGGSGVGVVSSRSQTRSEKYVSLSQIAF